MSRPKKITILDKDSINELVAYLLKYKKVSLSNLCVLELKETTTDDYYNVATGTRSNSPEYRVNIKKSRYLKDEIARQRKKK